MRHPSTIRSRRVPGFTLIELLVVVAIIALLISILLPSLSKARAQARTTLCLSRIAQLGKSVLIYSNDYNETPPFLGVGFENCGDHDDFEGRDTWDYWAAHEQWEIPDVRDAWDKPEDIWLANNPHNDVQHGTLFNYARFENLYRCPEFERTANKEQNMFNYTRTVLARRVLSRVVLDPVDDDLAPGPLLKLSAFHAPAAMYMLLDEAWDFHVAGIPNDQPEDGVFEDGIWGYWMGHESLHGIIGDTIGSYHGVLGKGANISGVEAGKKGGVLFYDGHADAIRDPLPGRIARVSMGDILSPEFLPEVTRVLSFVLTQIFGQRGIDFQVDDAVKLF